MKPSDATYRVWIGDHPPVQLRAPNARRAAMHYARTCIGTGIIYVQSKHRRTAFHWDGTNLLHKQLPEDV